MPVDLNFTYSNVYFGPKVGDMIQVTDPARNILDDYIVVKLSNGGYTLQRVSDCKVDEKEILEILQEN